MKVMWPGHKNDLPCRNVPHNSCYLLRFAKGVQQVLITSATYFSTTTMAAFAPRPSGSTAFSIREVVSMGYWLQPLESVQCLCQK